MILNLSELSGEPLYAQILRQIRAMILTGDLPQEEAIPSIRDLARTHKISVITVQKAYDELAREGLVIARRGKGYFVSSLATSERNQLAEDRCRETLRLTIERSLLDGLSPDIIRKLVNEIISDHKPSIKGDEGYDSSLKSKRPGKGPR